MLKLIPVSPWQEVCTVQEDQLQTSKYTNINHQFNYNQTSYHHHHSRQYHNILYNGILNKNNTTLASTRQTIPERLAPICKHYTPRKQIYIHNFRIYLASKKKRKQYLTTLYIINFLTAAKIYLSMYMPQHIMTQHTVNKPHSLGVTRMKNRNKKYSGKLLTDCTLSMPTLIVYKITYSYIL